MINDLKEPRIEKQELYCHECKCHVYFDIDLSLEGNHVLNCPNCGHEHCRVVKDGVITEQRWDTRNKIDPNAANTYIISQTTYTDLGMYDTYFNTTGTTNVAYTTQTPTITTSQTSTTPNLYTYDLWLNLSSS